MVFVREWFRNCISSQLSSPVRHIFLFLSPNERNDQTIIGGDTKRAPLNGDQIANRIK